MISKVIEEALENLIRRIDRLESSVAELKSTPKTTYPQKTGLATAGQVKYIRILKGDPWPEITKAEAGKEIDRLLKLKEEVTKSHQKSPNQKKSTQKMPD